MKTCDVCGARSDMDARPRLCPRCERLSKLMATEDGLSAARKLLEMRTNPPWTDFYPAILTPSPTHQALVRSGQLSQAALDAITSQKKRVFKNSRYQVIVFELRTVEKMPLVHLCIKRLDKEAHHDWRDFQRIKNELLGPTAEAVELYPDERRLVDTANQYHLWCFPGSHAPVGFDERLVADERHADLVGAKQRPFEEDNRPPDLAELTVPMLDALLMENNQ